MPSRTEYERATAFALNDLLICNASSATGTTVTCGELMNPDANASTARYDWRWFYCVVGANSGAQRTLTKGGYTPSTGVVTVTAGYGVNPIAGNVFDMTALFPRGAGALQADPSYQRLMLAAFRRLNVRRELTVAVTTSTRISLAAYADWITPDRVISVKEYSPAGTRLIDASWRQPRIIEGAIPYLEVRTPFPSASGNVILEVVSPAYAYIATAGVWAESTTGLAGETDQALVSVIHARDAALVEAYHALMSRGVERPDGPWADLWVKHLAYCQETIPDYDFGSARRPSNPSSPVDSSVPALVGQGQARPNGRAA